MLPIDEMARDDVSLNGIQVGDETREVTKVAAAVDGCRETFERAAALGADMLLVHHGLFWGKPLAVTGSHYRRIKFLMDKGLALYAAHLPLDSHPEVGNNAGLAGILDLQDREPFGDYHGTSIGVQGRLAEPLDLDRLMERLWGGVPGEGRVKVLPFGPELISSVGIVSGGAPRSVGEALGKGLDCFITGDASHEIYHQALEGGIHVIFAGHYWTEIWGVRRMLERMEKELGLETVFIDMPTGL